MILNQLRHLRFVMALLILWACSSVAKAQTNAQILYDFGSDRKFVTLTLEMFKQDKWGSTYFFVDHDFNYDKMVVGEKNIAQGGTYTEISRALNFWQKLSSKTGAFMWSTMVVSPRIIPSTMHGSSVWNTSCTTRITRTL